MTALGVEPGKDKTSLIYNQLLPTAYAVGCILSPLRG
jgi:hypothetical protein